MAEKGERVGVDLDPAVKAILGDDAARREARAGSKQERARTRERQAREREEAERQRNRNRVTLELDGRVHALLEAVAKREQVSPAGAANWLLGQALVEYDRGEISFEGCKVSTDSPRWWFRVNLEFDGMAGTLERIEKEGFS